MLEKEKMIKKYEVFKSYLPYFLDNIDEIHQVLEELLNEKQKKLLEPLKNKTIEFYKEVKSIE